MMKIKKLISGMILMSLTTSPVWAEESKLCRLKVDPVLRPITIAGVQESEPIFTPEPWKIGKDMSPNTALYSASFISEQSFGIEESKEEKKKGRIIGTTVGAGIGGGLGFILYAIVEGLGGFSEYPQEKPSPLIIIVPAIVGGLIGYNIGEHYDKKEGSR